MSVVVVILFVFAVTPVRATPTVCDKTLKQSIEDEAAENPRLKRADVELEVEDGYVVLYGTVGLYIQKMLYEQIAWKTKGVVEVDNEIRVVPRLPKTDIAVKRKILERVHADDRFKGVHVIVTVIKGAVHIRVTLEHPRDVLFLKHRVAEIEGVISIDIQANFIT